MKNCKLSFIFSQNFLLKKRGCPFFLDSPFLFSGSTGFGVTVGNFLFPASTPPSFANSDILVGVSLKTLQVFAFLRTALFVSNPVPCSLRNTFFKQKKLTSFEVSFHSFWVDRIRTCGIPAPKAGGLPLADDPIILSLKKLLVFFATNFYMTSIIL